MTQWAQQGQYTMKSKVLRFLPALALLATVVPGIVAAQVQVQRPAVQALMMDDVRFRFTCRSGRVPIVQPAPDGSVDLECKVDPLNSPIYPIPHPSPTGSFAAPTPDRPAASASWADGITDTLLVPIGDARSTPAGPGWRR